MLDLTSTATKSKRERKDKTLKSSKWEGGREGGMGSRGMETRDCQI